MLRRVEVDGVFVAAEDADGIAACVEQQRTDQLGVDGAGARRESASLHLPFPASRSAVKPAIRSLRAAISGEDGALGYGL